jgi:beta-phosphoglucomutase
MTDCVIFDMVGVLVDSYDAHYQSWRDVAATEGFDLKEDDFARTFGQTSREIIRAHWPVKNLDDTSIRAIDERKEAAFRRLIAHSVPVMDGARELIAALRSAGFKIAVGSSGPPENVFLALECFGGPPRFDAIVTGMDVERGKPDPQVFLLAARRAGVEASRAVVIEDAPPGIEAARRAGMAAVALVSTGRTEDDFRTVNPDLIVHSLRDLTPLRLRQVLSESVRPSR